MRLVLAQLDCVLGGVEKNLARAHEVVKEAGAAKADLVVFPELFLTGYSLGEVGDDVAIEVDDERMGSLAEAGGDTTATLIGFQEGGRQLYTFNSAAYLERGAVVHTHRKAFLATYGIFEEGKHFTPGPSIRAFDTRFGRMATLICFDAWQPAFVFVAVQDGANVLLVPSNSADRRFTDTLDNQGYWRDITHFYASIFECYVVFVNRVGSEGELNFWGGSHVVDPHGSVIAEGPTHDEALVGVDIDLGEVRRRRREAPLVKEGRLALLIKELNRLADQGAHL